MNRSSKIFKAGTRTSNLAITQTQHALDQISRLIPGVSFEIYQRLTPGDRDKTTDLRDSPDDFFTQDLDNAILSGEIDCAIHSAKDLPPQATDGIDWVWLPWREDARDVLVLPPGRTLAEMPDAPRIGISSDRREAYCRSRFPEAQFLPIRGNMDERLAQLDSDKFDLLITASAAMYRLGLEQRISEYIPLSDLSTPEGQGSIAMTFRHGDKRFQRIRSLLVRSVTFVGAGVGNAGNMTKAGIDALANCEVCLSDTLLPKAVLKDVPESAEIIDVGKRMGAHSADQSTITELITLYAKRGKRVVRLKGGDPSIFGRLAEEVDGLEAFGLPYRVIAGISSFSVASAETGMLLTRRGISRGFCVLTPRKAGGGIADITSTERAKLPIVFYMATSSTKAIAEQLQGDGMPADTPCALVYDAGGEHQNVVRATISTISDVLSSLPPNDLPGLFLIGENTAFSFDKTLGALQGKRILLTCSEALQPLASSIVHDLGGTPLPHPLIRLRPCEEAKRTIAEASEYDWMVVTSPSAAACLLDRMQAHKLCLRSLPKIMVTGPGTAREFEKRGIIPDAMPDTVFSAEAILDLATTAMETGDKVLRVRSTKAGSSLAEQLEQQGFNVTDCVLYSNEAVSADALPDFDAIYFASSSAVEAFFSTHKASDLDNKLITAIGKPTEAALKHHGISHAIIPHAATTESALHALAGAIVSKTLEAF